VKIITSALDNVPFGRLFEVVVPVLVNSGVLAANSLSAISASVY